MQLTIHVAVSSDDGKIGQNVVAKLTLATGVYGTDAGVAKQDFLQQAESLVRTVAENQIPALYDAVQKQIDGSEPAEADEPKDRNKMRDRLKAANDRRMKQKTKQKAEQADVQQEQDETQQDDQAQEESKEETQTQEEEQ